MRVLVTGAANGIGKEAADILRQDGADVVGLDLAEEADVSLDLSDMISIDAFQPEGRFDALINAAGLPPVPGKEVRVLTVNLHGLVRLTEQVLPALNAGGSIVSMASKAGSRWRENLEQVQRFLATPAEGVGDFVLRESVDAVRSYDLSKEALIVWTKAQTARLAQMDLRANTVSPAAVETRILGDFMTAFGDRASRGVELTGRPGTAREVGEVLAFLAGPKSGWIKGANIVVDGGLDARLDCAALGIAEAH